MLEHSTSQYKHLIFKQTREFKSDIILGKNSLLSSEWLRLLQERKNSKHFIISDKGIASFLGKKILSFLNSKNLRVYLITLPTGEKSKSFQTYEKLLKNILSIEPDRESYIIGLGGGVVNNIAGFIASTLYRGLSLIQIPTTLLAQVDAAVDLKQAINSPTGKNHIGSYYPAKMIVIDPTILKTLPIRDIRNGLAESIKHALLQSKRFYQYLEKYSGEINNQNFLEYVISTTLKLKLPLLSNLPNPDLSEMLPQYGHPLGHVIEFLSAYRLRHGEAIAIGMCVSAEIALLIGVSDQETITKHYTIMRKFGLPTSLPKNLLDKTILKELRRDKHYLKNMMRTVLVSKIGSISTSSGNFIYSIKNEIIREAIKRNRAFLN